MSTKPKKPKKTAAARKKQKTIARWIIRGLAFAFVATSVYFLFVLGGFVMEKYNELSATDNKSTNADHTPYETTATDQSDKVGYYLVGLAGKNPDEDPLETLSVVCFDKQAKTLRILQLPGATYIGEDDTWAVRTASKVWANPKDLPFCEVCGDIRVYTPDIDNDKHAACGTILTMKAGSAGTNLAELFNKQYSLPVDGYFILPQQAFVKLIDLVGGVDIELESTLKVEDTSYAKGLRTLDGAAALQYVTTYGDGIDKDIAHLTQVQKIMVSLLQRLFRADDTALQKEIIGPLQNGSTPIRVSRDYPATNIVSLIAELRQVPFSNMTSYVLPGESAKKSGTTYFSPHKAALLTLLNEQFNPYGRPITEADILLTELASGKKSDIHEKKWDTFVVPQSGQTNASTTNSTTTTTTKK